MTTQTEALKLALEALELAKHSYGKMLLSDPPQDAWKTYRVDDALIKSITAIKEALAQPEKNFVTIVDGPFNHRCPETPLHIKEALAQPKQFKPLTDDEAFELIEQDYQMEEYAQAALQLIRRVEAAHGIKV